jgi:hypothetical protein
VELIWFNLEVIVSFALVARSRIVSFAEATVLFMNSYLVSFSLAVMVWFKLCVRLETKSGKFWAR